MNRKMSLTSVIAMTIFMTATFATSQTQTIFAGADKFGFPLTFFTAVTNGEAIVDTNFSAIALIVNLGLCFAVAYGIVSALWLLKVEKKKPEFA
jgi:predicted outer membrane lipoprotein